MPSLAAKAKGHPPLADGQRSGLHREQRRVKALPRATTTAWQEEQSRRTNTREWEVDFCSRPIKDERGKRVWEVLATDAERSFEHAEYLPNNRINSGEVCGRHHSISFLPFQKGREGNERGRQRKRAMD